MAILLEARQVVEVVGDEAAVVAELEGHAPIYHFHFPLRRRR
jgi:hypothetical protein